MLKLTDQPQGSAFESILISMLPEQGKALVELRSKLEARKKMSDR